MKLFQEREAWALFKITAIGEAAGWALLLYGIAAGHYHMWGATFMLPVGGSIHGTIFIAYLLVVLAGFTSLGWSWRKAMLAVFLSIVPFATYIFEVWCEGVRRDAMMGSFRRVVVRGVIEIDGKVLAVQLSTGLEWQLPGGFVEQGETPPIALNRVIYKLTGIRPEVGELDHFDDGSAAGHGELTMYHSISNSSDFALESVAPRMHAVMAIDEVDYINPREVAGAKQGSASALPA